MSTILHLLDAWAKDDPNAVAQGWKGQTTWETIGVAEYRTRIESLARYLLQQGVGPGSVGLIFSYNCPAWVQLDLAFSLTGASSAGLYVNASARQIHYILEHSEAKILVVERNEDVSKIFGSRPFQELAPNLKKIIVLSPTDELPPNTVSFEAALALGKSVAGPNYNEMLSKIDPASQAVLIYTSGTTGQPKAIRLSHRNLMFAAGTYSGTWDEPEKPGRFFSFLPLAHVAERTIAVGVAIKSRYGVYFCSNPASIGAELREIQPTLLLCVPRLWDKLKEGAEKKFAHLPNRKQRVLRWAMEVSKRAVTLELRKKPIPAFLHLQWKIAERLVLRAMRRQLGLAEAKRTVSGAAALSPSTLDWYRGIGVRLIEAYALSESSGLLSCCMAEGEMSGTVGVPYPGVEIKLASDGEILTRGPHLFMGYFKEEAATHEVLKDGWLCTGDRGELDERGCLKFIGRKREIIKNAEGKMIAPLFLEARIESSPLIEQSVVIGNERPYLTALVTLSEGARRTQNAAEQVQMHLNSVNRELASHERIKRFQVLDTPFSVDRDEMTATLKIKRRVIEANYNTVIETMYS